MAAYSNHPASAPPAAPVRETTGHLMLRGWCIFVLFMALSSTAWLHAFGTVDDDDHHDRRRAWSRSSCGSSCARTCSGARLPWFVVAYVLWATLSLIWSAVARVDRCSR